MNRKKLLTIAVAMVMITCLLFTTVAFASSGSGSLDNFKKTTSYTAGQFTDVSSNAWYAVSVKTAYELGLVKGTSTSQFNPDGNLTIAETLALASRIHNIYYGGNGTFTQGSPWYQVYVDYAKDNKISTTSYSDYNAKASRSQFAAIMYNALPGSALTKINNIETLPDVGRSDQNANAIYGLYEAGILTGNDQYGTFNPSGNIKRSEASAIVTRMADTSLRKNVTLVSLGNQAYMDKLAEIKAEADGNGTPPFGSNTVLYRFLDVDSDGAEEMLVESQATLDENSSYVTCAIYKYNGNGVDCIFYDPFAWNSWQSSFWGYYESSGMLVMHFSHNSISCFSSYKWDGSQFKEDDSLDVEVEVPLNSSIEELRDITNDQMIKIIDGMNWGQKTDLLTGWKTYAQ